MSSAVNTVEDTNVATPAKTMAWWKTGRARRAAQIGVGVAIVGFAGWWFFLHPFVTTDDARVAMTLVRVAPSNVSGRVEKLLVDEGTHVKAGQVMLEIDHRIPQANYDRAKARDTLADREFQRMQRLSTDGSVTPQALDRARAEAAAAKAELELANVALENTYLKAPFDGIVVQKTTELGNILEQNQTAVVVADEAHAWVAANIEETYVGPVRVGQPVKIEIDEGGELHGKVSEVRASVASQFALIPSDNGAGNFTKVVQRVPIKIALEPHEGQVLRAGQSVEIKVRAR